MVRSVEEAAAIGATNVFGERLKMLRERAEESQRQLGEATFIAKGTIAKYEQGLTAPRIGTAMLLAAHFRVTVDYLCGLSDRI